MNRQLGWVLSLSVSLRSRFSCFDELLTLFCDVDFRKRFISLLSYKFREFASITALSVLEAATSGDTTQTTTCSSFAFSRATTN